MSAIARRLGKLDIDVGYLAIWQPSDITCSFFNGKGSEYFQRVCLDISLSDKLNSAKNNLTLVNADQFNDQVTKVMKELSHMKYAILCEVAIDLEVERDWIVTLQYSQGISFNRTFKLLEKAQSKIHKHIDDNFHLLDVKLGKNNVIQFPGSRLNAG